MQLRHVSASKPLVVDPVVGNMSSLWQNAPEAGVGTSQERRQKVDEAPEPVQIGVVGFRVKV